MGASGLVGTDLTSAPRSAQLVPVILCGGASTELWPVSRDSLPKQFWPLISSRTLLQEAALCATAPVGSAVSLAPPLVVCDQAHRFVAAAQLEAVGVRGARIVVDAAGRSSGHAATAAALLLGEDAPEPILWIVADRTLVADAEALQAALPAAAAVATRSGRIVALGTRPTAERSGVDLIEPGRPLDAVPEAYEVARFAEQRPGQAAADVAASGPHLLDSGVYVSTAAAMLREVGAHAPEVVRRAASAVEHRREDAGFLRLDGAAFADGPELAISRMLAERSQSAAVVSIDLDLLDVGSWDALWRISPKDLRGNVALGDVLLEAAENCYVRSEDALTAVVGLKDAVVVATGDAVLAMHRDRLGELAQAVQRLRRYGRKESFAHRRVLQPWGFHESLLLQPRYQVKRIVVEPGGRLGLRQHFHRAGHWVVVGGAALVTRGEERVLLQENESISLPFGCVYRVENPGRITLTMIEVQIGPYLAEDDIVRIEDDRAPA